LNKILDGQESQQMLRCVKLSPLVEARQFLETAGINAYSLFSDLAGLSRQLHDKYGIAYE
jgi:hypothetical protein